MPKHQNQQEEPDLELPDNIKMLKDAEVIYDTEDYQTAELPFPDPTGHTLHSNINKTQTRKTNKGAQTTKICGVVSFPTWKWLGATPQ